MYNIIEKLIAGYYNRYEIFFLCCHAWDKVIYIKIPRQLPRNKFNVHQNEYLSMILFRNV